MMTAAAATTPGSSIVWNLPYQRNARFVGREQYLSELRRHFDSDEAADHVQAIHGLGGVGKTQLAVEYAYRFKDQYKLVWWLNAEDSASLAMRYAELAQRLGQRTRADAPLDDLRKVVLHALDHRDDWLLIFDNVAAYESIVDYLPPWKRGHVLLTSRNSNPGDIARSIPLKKFDRGESIAFLRQRLVKPANLGDIVQLSQALGDLPLALEQAAAYIEQASITVPQYLRRFETHWAELLKRGKNTTDYPDSVAMTWEISFRDLELHSPAAADLLNLVSFLAPNDIDRELLRDGGAALPDSLAVAVEHAMMFDEMVEALERYSLIERNEDRFSLHRLVHAQARQRLNPDERKVWAERALAVARGAFAFDPTDLSTWQRSADVLPHVMAAAGQAHAERVDLVAVAKLLNLAGRFLHYRARYSEARDALQWAWKVGMLSFDEDDPRLAGIANDLGRVLRALGDTAQARHYLERALEIDEKTYGKANPRYASVMNNCGIMTFVGGDLFAAEEQFEWALTMLRGHYGHEHPKVASVLNNLGYVRWTTGGLGAARKHLEESLAVADKCISHSHPTVGRICHNLGGVLADLGELNAAEHHLRRALTISEDAFGVSHWMTCRDLDALADVLIHRGDTSEAMDLLTRSISLAEPVFGPDDKDMRERRRKLDALQSNIAASSSDSLPNLKMDPLVGPE